MKSSSKTPKVPSVGAEIEFLTDWPGAGPIFGSKGRL